MRVWGHGYGHASLAAFLAVAGVACTDAPDVAPAVGNARAASLLVNALITTEEAKLTPLVGRGTADEWLGYALAMDGDTALVGAPHDAAIGAPGGTAYVWLRTTSGWTAQAELAPGSAPNGAWYGEAVSVSGDTAIVGAFGDTTTSVETGSATVFLRSGTTWTQQAKLVASDAARLDAFGDSVAVSGDTAIVGATAGDTATGIESGCVYVFTRADTTWIERAKLVPSDAAAGDLFGSAVALGENTALIGAGRADTSAGADAGSAYVFVGSGSTWTEVAKLEAPGAAADDHFGDAIALSGDTAVIGASAADSGGSQDAGAAHVFVGGGAVWNHQAKLEADSSNADLQFGMSVAISSDVTLVGAPGYDATGASDAGSAYAFFRSGAAWSQPVKLESVLGEAGDAFGRAVVISGTTAFVGAPGFDTDAGDDAGSAYVFERSDQSFIEQARLDAGDSCEYDAFGSAVAFDGYTAVVGAPQDYKSPWGSGSGGAYVFTLSGNEWARNVELAPSEPQTSDGFGYAIAVDGARILIGARDYSLETVSYAGRAHVFTGSGDTWLEEGTLTASDAAEFDAFGSAVALKGDIALVGAPFVDSGAESAGAAYVFVRNGSEWLPEDKLTAADGGPGDALGKSVVLDGDTALIGAPSDATTTGTSPGGAYVFVRTGTSWTPQGKLEPNDGAAGDFFGSSVALFGDTALIGAPGDDTLAGDAAGSAYIFARTGTAWAQTAKLEPSDAHEGNAFGKSVALDGSLAVIGADNNVASIAPGNAYVFAGGGSTWIEQTKLVASDSADFDGFGASVAVRGETALVGAPIANLMSFWGSTSQGVGATYVFRVGQCATGSECSTGYCVDGRCCDTPCGGGVTDDCQACSVLFGGTVDGVCGPVAATAAKQCRPSAGICDLAETCDGSSTVCPADRYLSNAQQCGAPTCTAGVATLASFCTGSAPDCPTAQTQPCGDYACGATACLASCDTAADCASGLLCDGAGACVPGGSAGTGGTAGAAGASGADGGPDAAAGSGGGASDANTAGADAGADASGGVAGASSGGTGGLGAAGGGTPGTPGADAGSGAGSGGVAGRPPTDPGDGGCGCEVPAAGTPAPFWQLILVALGAFVRKSSRRAKA